MLGREGRNGECMVGDRDPVQVPEVEGVERAVVRGSHRRARGRVTLNGRQVKGLFNPPGRGSKLLKCQVELGINNNSW